MLKYLFAFLLLLHGSIHFMGFAKAFGYGDIKNLTIPISRLLGTIWMFAAFLFIMAAILYLLKKEAWWALALIAIVLSQWAILSSWKDAGWGTIANVIVLLVAIAGWGSYRFERRFRHEVSVSLQQSAQWHPELLTEKDLQPLPSLVQSYIRFSGALNQPKVKNMRVKFSGEMREKGKAFFPFVSEQYNFFDEPTRLFYMKAKLFGMTVPGYHRYSLGKASMDVRIGGLIPVLRHSGPVMDKTETVTLFNDMCLLAPATLIDPRIRWEAVDGQNVKAIFTNRGITISAILRFGADGRLVDFLSNDRTAIADGREYTFSTPIYDYRKVGDRMQMTGGDANWHYPDGIFTYGKFHLLSLAYNVR